MTTLLECSNEVFRRGTVFRAKGSYPYEEVVDFMVFETLDEDCRFGLMVTTGYKAGLPLVWLPREQCRTPRTQQEVGFGQLGQVDLSGL
ncbi:Imm45 family immunity protein [Pseudomonas fulva]|uniref:Imm45 family immunity protein n=1 Tax=Pseudomonas fulva TaxID=47880 RepID=UPI0022A7A362|nr:Imm45 family immunity protein [Pseudomonas fulva]